MPVKEAHGHTRRHNEVTKEDEVVFATKEWPRTSTRLSKIKFDATEVAKLPLQPSAFATKVKKPRCEKIFKFNEAAIIA